MSNRMYKTLPTAFRGRGENNSDSKDPGAVGGGGGGGGVGGAGKQRRAAAGDSQQPFFGGLNLNLGISNLISGGINFLGQFRRRTPSSTPVHSNSPSTPAAAAAAHFAGKASFSSSTSGGASRSSSFDSDANCYYDARSGGGGELFELCSFPTLPEAAGEGQTGEGHQFEPIGSFNPTWCDLCGDLVWGLYDTGASKCVHCHYTCHVKCQRRVRLNCSILQADLNKAEPLESFDVGGEDFDEATLANISTLRNEEVLGNQYSDAAEDEDSRTLKDVDHILIDHDGFSDKHASVTVPVHALPLNSSLMFGDSLQSVVEEYNALSPSGQETVIERESTSCRGFIRVLLNLRRPINVISGTRPPSIYNIMKDDTLGNQTLTSFYLPAETVSALHVTSETTTRDVIRSLLDKFRVADTPYKYAMYEKTLRGSSSSTDREDGTIRALSRIQMRKLRNDERPLVLALMWCREGVSDEKYLVLQENDPGDISWDSFSTPELKNFLLILDREEAWYKKRIHDKYEAVRVHMQALVIEKRPSLSDTNSTTAT